MAAPASDAHSDGDTDLVSWAAAAHSDGDTGLVSWAAAAADAHSDGATGQLLPIGPLTEQQTANSWQMVKRNTGDMIVAVRSGILVLKVPLGHMDVSFGVLT